MLFVLIWTCCYHLLIYIHCCEELWDFVFYKGTAFSGKSGLIFDFMGSFSGYTCRILYRGTRVTHLYFLISLWRVPPKFIGNPKLDFILLFGATPFFGWAFLFNCDFHIWDCIVYVMSFLWNVIL